MGISLPIYYLMAHMTIERVLGKCYVVAQINLMPCHGAWANVCLGAKGKSTSDMAQGRHDHSEGILNVHVWWHKHNSGHMIWCMVLLTI